MISNNELKEILITNILGYWKENLIDKENGGFYGRIGGDEQLYKNADKAIILNTRLLWTFSAAYNFTTDDSYIKLAKRAYKYIVDNFVDKKYGGVFWLLDYTGVALNSKKQIYGQAFAIYGLSEYYKASGEKEALTLAIKLFRFIEKYSFDNNKNGYFEALDEKWKELDDVRLSEKDSNAHKTMNTHLHILEAYTSLFSVWPNAELRIKLKNLIEVMMLKFINHNYHFNLFFSKDWVLLSNEISYGHDIEGSWLLVEAVIVLDEPALASKVKSAAIKMVDSALEGLDIDGGLMNEGDPNGVYDTDKHWWQQAEAVVGLVNAWQLTNNIYYLKQAKKVWEFIKLNIIDYKNGEWHWKVTREGKQDFNEDKAGPWKCPYHNGRALMEVINRLSLVGNTAI